MCFDVIDEVANHLDAMPEATVIMGDVLGHVAWSESASPDRPHLAPRLGVVKSNRVASQVCVAVGTVEDGIQLLEEAARLQPVVIVLDLSMPGMNGVDACRELTRMLPRTIIIALTADADEDVKRVALAAGAFAFIGKRAAGTDLLPALRMACSERHIAR